MSYSKVTGKTLLRHFMHRPKTDSDIALMTISAADKLSETVEKNEY